MNIAAIFAILNAAALSIAGAYTAKTSSLLHERAHEYLRAKKDSDSHAMTAAAATTSIASAVYFVAASLFVVAVLAHA